MSTERSVLTVSALSQQLSAVMEERFPAVWVEGEVSNFKVYGSGHAYFTLKDEGAQLRCVLPQPRAPALRAQGG
jgi:exodeoxyribonuclease VII large subunit